MLSFSEFLVSCCHLLFLMHYVNVCANCNAKSIQLEDLKLLSTYQNLFRTSELVVSISKVYFSA